MLVLFLPEQIARHWDVIREAISEALPPTVRSRENLNKVLESLLIGNMQCWISVSSRTKQVNAIVTTSVVTDAVTEEKSLLIFSVFAYGPLDDIAWKEGFNTLRIFGRSKDCVSMVAYTENPYIVELGKKYNGGVFSYITIPL